MKKFYFFLVAMVLGVMSASAVDYTLIGSGTSIGWSTSSTDLKFTKVSDTEYVLDYNGTLTSGFKVKSLENDWNDAMNWGSSNSDTNKLTIGETFNLTNGSGSKDINIAGGLTATNPHIVFNPVAQTLLVTTSQVSEATVTYALWGNLPNASSGDWSRTELDDAGNDIWSIEGLEISLASNFGIQYLEDGNQTKWIWATGNSIISGEGGNYACGFNTESEGADFTINPGVWDLSFNAKSMTLTAKKTGASEVEISYCIHGNLADEGGMAWTNIELTNSAENVWSVTDVVVGDKNGTPQFGIKPILDGAVTDGWIALPKSGDVEFVLVQSGTYQLVDNNAANIAIAAGTYDFSFDASTMKITITRHGGDTPVVTDYPAQLYLIGNVCDWNPANGVAANTAEDGVYTWNSVELKAADDLGYSYFSFTTAVGADWEADINTSDRYGATSKDEVITSTASIKRYAAAPSLDPNAWMAKAGTYKVIADLTKMELTITQTNSVAAIEAAEDVAPVYYNLQGVRVDAPANGLYIVVRGDKVAKELVK